MQTRPLGRTGLRLPILGLGTAPLGQEYGRFNIDEALAAIPAALDLGINFLDTSPYYGRGMSEVLLGMARARRRAATATSCAPSSAAMTWAISIFRSTEWRRAST